MLVLMLHHFSSRVSGVPLASPCLWEKLHNLTCFTVSKQVVMSFCMAGVALRDVLTCLQTCRKFLLCDRCDTFARFSTDELHLSWQAQHSGDLHRHFAWQVQHFRRVALRALHSTLSTLHTLHSTLYTPRSTLYTPHSTLYTLHPSLYTPHFTLYTLYSTLRTLLSTLYTQHFTL